MMMGDGDEEDDDDEDDIILAFSSPCLAGAFFASSYCWVACNLQRWSVIILLVKHLGDDTARLGFTNARSVILI